jgi:hypothetical protein
MPIPDFYSSAHCSHESFNIAYLSRAHRCDGVLCNFLSLIPCFIVTIYVIYVYRVNKLKLRSILNLCHHREPSAFHLHSAFLPYHCLFIVYLYTPHTPIHPYIYYYNNVPNSYRQSSSFLPCRFRTSYSSYPFLRPSSTYIVR